jgi:hypothetical protein
VAGDGQPAVGVSWHDARTYCGWSGKRLASVRDLGTEKPNIAIWLADKVGKRRAVRGPGAKAPELPSARAHWLSFRCVQ